MIAVVAALPEELRPLVEKTRARRLGRAGPARCFAAELEGRKLLLATTGDGHRRAREGLEAILDRFEIERVLFAGIAGGLSPGLEPGQVIVGREVRDHDGPAPGPDPEWLERAAALEDVTPGTLLSATEIATTSEDKKRLYGSLETAGPATVDLETATWTRLAASRGIPYLALRAVCDTAEETLPLDFNRFSDAGGQVRRWRVALHAVTHPWLILELRRLERRVRLATEKLAAALPSLFKTS